MSTRIDFMRGKTTEQIADEQVETYSMIADKQMVIQMAGEYCKLITQEFNMLLMCTGFDTGFFEAVNESRKRAMALFMRALELYANEPDEKNLRALANCYAASLTILQEVSDMMW